MPGATGRIPVCHQEHYLPDPVQLLSHKNQHGLFAIKGAFYSAVYWGKNYTSLYKGSWSIILLCIEVNDFYLSTINKYIIHTYNHKY